jgi:GDP-D-mannose dehydratase
LCGKPTKANNVLNWYPKISFKELVKEMVEADIERELNG